MRKQVEIKGGTERERKGTEKKEITGKRDKQQQQKERVMVSTV